MHCIEREGENYFPPIAVQMTKSKCPHCPKSCPHDSLQKYLRGHTDLNHGPIGLQPIALPLSYIPKTDAGGLKCSDAHGR